MSCSRFEDLKMARIIDQKLQLAYNERYRQYTIAKEDLPRGLSPQEYEKEVKRLAKKFKI